MFKINTHNFIAIEKGRLTLGSSILQICKMDSVAISTCSKRMNRED